ncbi:hypothetical protein OH807_02850 [Kitasatospora sp. NBC_01560]|uniref:hypothetical protein n=1 Tax=Kitasatospora sp. NBC_01560 TaxID=2975965 RepID=UPI00386ADC3C
MGVEDDCLGVRLEVLTAVRRVGPVDPADVAADVASVQVELLLQRCSTARDVVPQRGRDRFELFRLVDRAIDDGDESGQLGPLLVADGGEDLARQRDVGPDQPRDLTRPVVAPRMDC